MIALNANNMYPSLNCSQIHPKIVTLLIFFLKEEDAFFRKDDFRQAGGGHTSGL